MSDELFRGVTRGVASGVDAGASAQLPVMQARLKKFDPLSDDGKIAALSNPPADIFIAQFCGPRRHGIGFTLPRP